MRKHGWRLLAWAAAVSLGSFVAGCGDDNGGMPDLTANGNPDLTVVTPPPDLSVTDSSVDMALGPGAGQVIVADVVGTVWAPVDVDAGTESPAPVTHMLLTSVGYPDKSYPSDVNGVVVTTTPPSISGCDANWYDAAGTHMPHPDSSVGTITITGYNPKRLAAGVSAPGAGNPSGLGGIAPATVNCVNPTPLGGGVTIPFYSCFYGTPGGATTPIDGHPTNPVVFPLIGPAGSAAAAPATYGGACAAFAGGGCAATDCTHVITADGTNFYCEQDLWEPGAATNQAVVTVPGGAGFGAFTATIGTGGSCTPTCLLPENRHFPENVTIVSISVGGTALAKNAIGLYTLDALDANFDGTNDVTIQWACVPPTCGAGGCTLPTVGQGCTDTTVYGVTNYLILAGVTSAAPRSQFKLGTKYGSLTCFEQTNKSGGANPYTMTIPKAAVKAFLGTQTGGSAELILMSTEAAAIITKPQQLLGAGHGQFAFIHHP